MTYGAIQKRLKAQSGKGCSNSTLKPVYAEWKRETEYSPRIESDPELPPAVQKSLIAIGHTILREGEERARSKLAEQQRQLDRQAEILLEVDGEIAIAADRLEEEIANLRLEVTGSTKPWPGPRRAAVIPSPNISRASPPPRNPVRWPPSQPRRPTSTRRTHERRIPTLC